MKSITSILTAVLFALQSGPAASAGTPDQPPGYHGFRSDTPQRAGSYRYRSGRDTGDVQEETGRILHSAVWSGSEVIVWGGGADGIFLRNGWRIDPAAGTRRPVSEAGAPSARWGHSAVWTGSRMIVWGGRDQFVSEHHKCDGAAYDPSTDSWTPLCAEGAPQPRSQMAAVWTDSEMIVWGGFGDGGVAWNNGARYNPALDRWTPLPDICAPDARVEPVFVWTGTELIIWGGITPDLRRTVNSGARFNPATSQWTPIHSHVAPQGTWGHQAVWTGSEMLLWGGARQDGVDNENKVTRMGAAYNPAANTWRQIPQEGAPAARFFHSTVWTGTSMIVWGGGDQKDQQSFNDGAEFIPAENRWRPLDSIATTPARGMHTATWTPHGMVVFGGSTGGSSAFSGPALVVRHRW